jgi:pyruvate/2-oxoglutarate dehydrogenase complex dihydrolipoamide dehydrogenase (E3) component
MHLTRHPDVWGIHTKGAGFDFSRVMARKDELVKDFANYRIQQLETGRFQFRRAQARFTDPHTVKLNTGETVTAKNFIISTGSSVAPSPLPQLNAVPYLTSDSALRLAKLPQSMIVLGGGAVAMEFGQFFARFDVKVTLIQRSPHVLHEFDADAATVLENVFRREGVDVFTGTKLLDARQEGTLKAVSFLHQERKLHVTAEEIFFALGRIPNTASLDLDKAGVLTDWGRIITNDRMQSNVPHIYAAGDCTGPYEIVHLAVQQGEIAAHNIAHPEAVRRMDYRLKAEVVFTDPQIAVVGLTEKEARTRNIPCVAASYPFSDHGKSLIMEAKDGFVKLLASPQTGEIIGGCCVGPLAGELIHEIMAAMAKRMTARELAAMPHYHPTLAEIWTYPAEELAERIKT